MTSVRGSDGCLCISSLVQLSVGGNGLSDSGLQRLTAPVRMRRSGLDGLRVLDVSCQFMV